MLQIFSDGPKNAYENMQIDREILQSHSLCPVFRLYSFSSFCATIGIFTPKEGLIDEGACKSLGIQIATRPSGGGLLFHEEDLSFCIYIPGAELKIAPVEICRDINEVILRALSPFLGLPKQVVECTFLQSRFCYSTVTSFDLIWHNVKIGGCAQRRSRHGTLHQGSIFLKKPDWDTISSIILNQGELVQMRAASVPLSDLLVKNISEQTLRNSIIQNMRTYFE